MRCIFNVASDIQSATFVETGLTLAVVYHPGMAEDNGSNVLPHWTVKMKYPGISGSAHLMFRMTDGKYVLGARKRNLFPATLFNSILAELLRETNEVSADTEAGTLASA